MPAALDPRRRSLLGVAGAVTVVALAVSGCSAGQDAQTVEQTSVVDGVAFQAGQVDLRDVGLRGPSGPSYDAGANVYLEGLIVNKAASDDTLVSVSSPAASSVVIYSDGVTAALALGAAATTSTTTASATASASTSPSDSSSPTDTASPTDSSSSSATPTGSTSASSPAAAAPTPLTEVPLPTNRSVQFGYSNQQLSIVFVGLTSALFPAQSIPVTFTFANGGSVTATISVKLPVDSSLEAPTVNTEEQEGGGE